MRATILAIVLLGLTQLYSQNAAREKADREAVDYAKKVSISTLDGTLPRVSLEFFLENESDGARIVWEVNDCGEQTGAPEIDRGRDLPMCVEAEVYLKDQRSLNVWLTVGTFKKGVSGKPFIWDVMLTENDGTERSIQLRAIPVELHRPDRKPAKDLPGVK